MSKRHPTPFFRSLPRSAFLATGLKSLHTAFTGGRGRSPMPSRDTLIPCHKSPLPSSFPHMLLGRVGTHQQLRPFQKIPSRLWPPAKDNKKAVSLLQLTACFYCGAPEEIRTPGLQVRSLLLYPAELRARREKLCIAIALPCQILSAKKINFYAAAIAGPRFRCGRGSRTGPFPCTICRPSRNSTADSPPNVPGIYEEDIGRKQIPQKCGKETLRAVHHRAHRKRAAGMFLIRGGASFPTIPG